MSYTAIGLAYDIVGVIVLAAGLIGMRNREMAAQAATLPGANPRHYHSLRLQRFDAWAGVILLVVGFSGQLVGTSGVNLSANTRDILIAFLAWYLFGYGAIRSQIKFTRDY